MTYAISKNLKTHAIITFTGEHFFITAEQERQLRYLDNNAFILLPTAKIKVSNIANILSLNEYYSQYPQKRPTNFNYTYPNGIKDRNQIDRIIGPIKSREKRKRILESLRRGLLKYINSSQYQGTDKPKKLLQKIEYKIKTL